MGGTAKTYVLCYGRHSHQDGPARLLLLLNLKALVPSAFRQSEDILGTSWNLQSLTSFIASNPQYQFFKQRWSWVSEHQMQGAIMAKTSTRRVVPGDLARPCVTFLESASPGRVTLPVVTSVRSKLHTAGDQFCHRVNSTGARWTHLARLAQASQGLALIVNNSFLGCLLCFSYYSFGSIHTILSIVNKFSLTKCIVHSNTMI